MVKKILKGSFYILASWLFFSLGILMIFSIIKDAESWWYAFGAGAYMFAGSYFINRAMGDD